MTTSEWHAYIKRLLSNGPCMRGQDAIVNLDEAVKSLGEAPYRFPSKDATKSDGERAAAERETDAAGSLLFNHIKD